MPMPKCKPPSRILFLVPLLVSCTIASTPESVAPAVFHVKAPQAQRVSVVGTFNGWDPEAHPLHGRSEEHTSELQSQSNLVCRLLLEKKTQIPEPRPQRGVDDRAGDHLHQRRQH